MKKISLISIVVFLTFSVSAQQKQDYSQTLRKEFNLTAQSSVSITNQFGLVKIENWDKPVVSIEVIITASSEDKKKADRILESIKVSMQEKGSEVVLRTTIGNMPERKKKEHFSVDYHVKLPANTPMSISNEFGTVAADKRLGDFSLDISYGSYALMGLEGTRNKLDISFSKGNVTEIKDAEVSLSYSTLNADKAGSIHLKSEFSHLHVKTLTDAKIESSYDEINIENSGKLNMKGEFSTFRLGQVEESLTGKFSYGSVSVKSLSERFQLLDVNLSFSSLSIDKTKQSSFRKVEVKTTNGSFRYPGRWSLMTDKPDYTTRVYTGSDGQAKGQLLKISADYSSVKIMD
jgi:hypothetical protein